MNAFSVRRWSAASAVAVLLVSWSLSAAPNAPDSIQTRTNIVTEPAAATSLRLRNATALTFAPDLAGELGSGRALASADFDEDGVPDLVTSYDGARGARLVVQRGNIDAIYPHSDEARARQQRGEFTSAAFHRADGSLALPEAADFLGAGDFDADGHWDIVAARNGGTKLYWLRGDGRGNFVAPETFELAGTITALATGEINRLDGLDEIAVGIQTADGPRALVFESAEGALRGAPETLVLAAPATAFAMGQLDTDPSNELAIASGREVVVVHGRDRKLSLDAESQRTVQPARFSRSGFDSAVVAIATGDFSGDARPELAALTADGSMRTLELQGATMTASTAVSVGGSSAPRRLLATKVSALPKHDLLVFGGDNGLQVITTRNADALDQAGNVVRVGSEQMTVAASVSSAGGEVMAVLPMRLGTDALKDLVLVNQDGGAPVVVESHGGSTFVVNNAGTTNDKAPGDGLCEDDNGDCTFSAVIQETNAHPGADTIHFNLPGKGPHIVSPQFNQSFNETITIDGTTQPNGRVEVVGNGTYSIGLYGNNSVVRGLSIYASNTAVYLLGSNSIFEGNYVGIRADGSKHGFDQYASGIALRGGVNSAYAGNNCLIGGTTAQARNVISNCEVAIYLSDNTGEVIQGNYIGTNVAGSAAMPNRRAIVAQSLPDVVIGGTAPRAGNVISASSSDAGDAAIAVSSTRSVLIQGNRIGTSADGKQAIPNRGPGIDANNGVVTIGGTTPAARNVISASGSHAIQIYSDYFFADSDERVQGNYIGTNAQGTAALPNAGNGVHTGGAQKVTIGGAVSGAGNLISGNTGHGINIGGGINGTPSSAVIQGNLVGTDVSGTLALPNSESGLHLAVCDNGKVGGTTAKERNVISGNAKHGIILGNATANPSRIQGNLIGVNIFGTGALGNGEHGIHIDNGGGHLVGGTAPGAGNLIAFNLGAGIASSFRDYLGGSILSNSIFANHRLGLDSGGDGPTSNDNRRYSHTPVITSVSTSGSKTVIKGNLRTSTFGPQGPFTIQFFSNASPDPSGYGEGQTFIGETKITAGGNVEVPFSATVTPAVPAGRYISAVAIGVHDTQNNGIPLTSEFSFNFRAPGNPLNNPLQIHALTPSIGGDTGVVTVKIYGEGIRAGATVLLRRPGQKDIVGKVLSVSSDGTVIEVSFDLASKPLGSGYDILVKNPNGDKAGLENAFTVQQGREDRVWTNTTGPSLVRIGRPVRYFVNYGNTGNVDAPPTLVRIYVPRGVEVTEPLRLPDGSFPAIYPGDAETVLEFYLPRIAPATAEAAPLLLTPRQEFPDGTIALSGATISSPALKAASKTEINPKIEVTEEVLESTDTFEKTALHVTGPSGRSDLVRTVALSQTSEYRELSVQRVVVGNRVRNVVRYTLPKSVVPGPLGTASSRSANDQYAAIVDASSTGDDQVTTAAVSAASITPDHAGGTVTVTIRGQGLQNGTRVKLTRSGQREVLAKGVSAATNGLSALVYFDLRNVALGKWNVVLVGADGTTAQLPDGFTVEAAFVAVDDIVEGPAGEPGQADEIARAMTDLAMSAAADNQTDPVDVYDAAGVGIDAATRAALAVRPTATNRPRDPGKFDTRRTPSEVKRQIDETAKQKIVPKQPPQPSGETEPPEVPSRTPEDVVPFIPLSPTPPPTPTPSPTVTPSPTPEPEPTPIPIPPGPIKRIIDWILDLRPRTSWDPNDKIGPIGAKAQHYISGLEPLSYVILFENKPEASAAAQEVVITDQLDVSKFDLSTFQLGTISFGKDTVATPPPGTRQWIKDIDLRPANNLIVRVIAGLDETTGVATWRFLSLDPATMQPTEDALAGFLPPNKNAPEGDGAVTFSVRAKRGQPAGTEIRNKAQIIFDANAPIDTPEWLNIIDKSTPRSEVNALPEKTKSSEFRVSWSGTDTGSGIESYAIYVSEDGGAFRFWIQTSATSALFQGRPGATYRFYSIALDGAGNYEAAPGPADAMTAIAIGRLLNISTRVNVGTGENALIGGFIITGTQPKKVIIRAIGPSLAGQGVTGALQDPTLQLVDGAKQEIAFNDDWQDTQQEAIEDSGVPPSHEAESAIVRTLAPGFYTAIMRGDAQGTGIGLVEVFDLSGKAASQLANISSRAFVGTGDNVLIGGFISGGGADTRVLVRAIGPSLKSAGIADALENPTLELRDGNGTLVRENDNWQGSQQGEIEQTKIPPKHAAESALIEILRPGNYTAIVRGQGGSTGVALVEVYSLQ